MGSTDCLPGEGRAEKEEGMVTKGVTLIAKL